MELKVKSLEAYEKQKMQEVGQQSVIFLVSGWLLSADSASMTSSIHCSIVHDNAGVCFAKLPYFCMYNPPAKLLSFSSKVQGELYANFAWRCGFKAARRALP